MISTRRRYVLVLACLMAMANVALLPLGHGALLYPHGSEGTRPPLPDFSDLVERYGAAVVNVSVATPAPPEAEGTIPGAFHESAFFRYFGARAPAAAGPPQHGEASGFIVDSAGLILTNAHVVQGADTVTVRLTDRREFAAHVLGTDARTDIAVLKIQASGLRAVRLGRDKDVRVGQWVVAIGSPYGFENSVTSGIVSAKARSLPDGAAVPFLQTDVPLNPGSSGGPLIDLEGRVIGINAQIFSRTGGYQGIGFAIPIDLAMKVERQILQNGRAEHGHLGVDVQDLSPPLARAFGLDDVDGVLIGRVEPGSPAAQSGLQPGDVVRRFNDHRMRDAAAFAVAVADQAPDAVVKLDVWRSGGGLLLTTTMGRGTDAPGAALPAASDRTLGLALRPLTAAERVASGLASGLVVAAVTGAAARAGIVEGDVVLAVNGQPLWSQAQLSAEQLSTEQLSVAPVARRPVAGHVRPVALLVRRGAMQIYVPVDQDDSAG